VESVFTRNPFAFMNTTFFAAMFGLTYLCVDPILKTIYVLRCFYGESVKSGEDLKAELKRFALAPQTGALVLAVLMTFAGTTLAVEHSTAENAPSGNPQLEVQTSPPASERANTAKPASLSTPDLDNAINRTIHERKYTWRMPREKIPESDAEKGTLTKFFDKVADLIRKCVKAISDWLDKWMRKLSRRQSIDNSTQSSGSGWITSSQALLFALLAAVICVLAIFMYRLWQRRRQSTVVASEPIQSVPDITDENVGADQLPEDGWTQLARELLARGEFRLAMRAFYLATLAHLAQRNLITIARFKSNRDYERELRRRGHSFPDLLAIFGDNLSVFERIWYGMYEVNGEAVNQFAANVDRMKGGG